MQEKKLRIILELNSSDTKIGAVNDALDLVHFTKNMNVQFYLTGTVDEAMKIRAKQMKIPTIRGQSRVISKAGFILFIFSVAAWIAKIVFHRIHLVHLNYAGYGPSLACAAWICRIPVVARAGVYDPRNWANRWVTAYVANGQAHAQQLLDSPLAFKVFIAGDLFRPERLSDVGQLERLLPPQNSRPRFLFLGQLVERKGLAILIDAFSRMQEDAELMLAGGNWEDCGFPRQLRTLLMQLKIEDRVYLENHRSDVAVLLQQCDVFVLPSLSEARPRSIIEAMCVGRPVIGTNVGGIPSLIEDGVTGMLVPPGDSSTLAAAMDKMAKSEDLRRQYGKAGKARAFEAFQPGRTASRYVYLYRSLVNSSPVPK
jgi:glycosyltransferase involved in cell wall biosynthesis